MTEVGQQNSHKLSKTAIRKQKKKLKRLMKIKQKLMSQMKQKPKPDLIDLSFPEQVEETKLNILGDEK